MYQWARPLLFLGSVYRISYAEVGIEETEEGIMLLEFLEGNYPFAANNPNSAERLLPGGPCSEVDILYKKSQLLPLSAA